ncbi:helix-turn-helix domain-containing protein [Polyangium spumosum]|uniref:Helix-turn-helix domain-containing protein n=1 Tax=Polyangium spumosum TaxID=889282 RepID=A0A6N7PS14_9BACT|nr:helix-turn-helix domain-containing protein [Polyangium spumosum]
MPRRTVPDPFASQVGGRIRELRLERGMSLAELADASELSKGHLSSVEHGLAAITIQTISRLARGAQSAAPLLADLPRGRRARARRGARPQAAHGSGPQAPPSAPGPARPAKALTLPR